jgi:MPBQ/MSBQ methyltransferase
MPEHENREGTDYGLRLMAEVMKLDHLHWGYFPEKRFTGEKFTLTEVKQAQLEYTKRLFSYIPATVKTILDVGAGVGTTARLLTEKGFQVHCLSNDRYQQTVINQKYPTIPFTKSKFEECRFETKFDLVLMSESSQYLDWPRALAKLKEILNPGGYLLLADYFRKENDPFYKTCKVKAPFMEVTQKSFSLLKEEDITDNALPTLEFGGYCYQQYMLPAADIISDMLDNKVPGIIKFLVKLTLGGQLKKARYYIWEHTPDKFDTAKFKAKLNYVIQLWQEK